MRKIIILFFLIIALIFTTHAQSDLRAKIEFEEGEKAFAQNNFEEAFTRLSKAQDYLGVWSGKISYVKILSLDKLANYQQFENNHTQLLSKEVKLYMDFFNKNPDQIIEEKFKEVYRIDEKLNYSQKLSLNEKMPEYLQGIEAYDKKDYAAALKLWEQAAAKNNPLAMDKISDMYRDEIGVKKDYNKAMEWDKKAAALGHFPSIADIGTMYYYGRGVIIDYQKAVEKLTIAAENGVDYAMYNLGLVYTDKKSTVQDNAKGLEWFKKGMDAYKLSASKGSADAMFQVGYFHSSGKGTPVNYPEAILWFQKAIDNGSIQAMLHCGWHHQYGLGVSKDVKKAIYYFTMGAEKGNPSEWIPTSNCMEALAEIYKTGDGVKKDKKLAEQWQAKCDAMRPKK